MIWFTADYHLGHHNIIRYCDRPFKNGKEMNRAIISNHNSVVAERDTVFFLGDICFNRIDQYWRDLNGSIIWIEGNHDRRISMPYRLKSAFLKINGRRVFMTHSEESIPNMDEYDLYLVGHSHNAWKFKDKLINVGCDNWNFTPIRFDYMIREYKRWKKGK